MIKNIGDVQAVRDYLSRIGAEVRSMRTAVVKEHRGAYWQDVAIIRFSKKGEITCEDERYAPTEDETKAIADALSNVSWPELKLLKRIVNAPKQLQDALRRDLAFEFKNSEGDIVMVQIRVETKKGEKAYIPYTYWSDDEWRCMEPEGPLPLYNADRLTEGCIVFIHEGAKAARHAQTLADEETRPAKKALAEHPWGRNMKHCVHVGWIGGALSPSRTDWSVMQKKGISHAYIVADNDPPGKAAIPKIAFHLRVPTFAVQFTDEFPASFDLADPFPEKLFGEVGGVKFYTGPSFRDCLHPATWMTDLVPVPKGRPATVLRDCAKAMWAYVEELDAFVCAEMPETIRGEKVLNNMLAPFSHVSETSKLIVKAYQGRNTRVCYRPDQEGLLVTFRGSSAINLHVPATIRAKSGDEAPFHEFFEYMFPNAGERKEVARWCATLIARPDIRMGYGLLLISETQGIGKTTLGSMILGPLVGLHNVSYPRESDIVSDYNGWIAQKRLAIVSEIYSGASWKSYQLLKSVITDKDISVNEKYQRPYIIENWCHVLACSNSMRALKMENDDRRWFYPECSETPWPRGKFEALRKWVESGGLSIIKNWAESYGDYVSPSDRAPMTERKKEMIEGSRSDAQKEAAALAEELYALEKPAAVILKDVVQWCRDTTHGRVYDSDYEIRRAMCDLGLKAFEKRVKIGPRMNYVLMNPELCKVIDGKELREQTEVIRAAIVKCSDVLATEM